MNEYTPDFRRPAADGRDCPNAHFDNLTRPADAEHGLFGDSIRSIEKTMNEPLPGNYFALLFDVEDSNFWKDTPFVIAHEDCNYSLGEGLFLDLYNTLDAGTFRQGFRNLYRKSLQDDDTDDCDGTKLGICHLKSAFQAVVPSDADAAKVTDIVSRWYGTAP